MKIKAFSLKIEGLTSKCILGHMCEALLVFQPVFQVRKLAGTKIRMRSPALQVRCT